MASLDVAYPLPGRWQASGGLEGAVGVARVFGLESNGREGEPFSVLLGEVLYDYPGDLTAAVVAGLRPVVLTDAERAVVGELARRAGLQGYSERGATLAGIAGLCASLAAAEAGGADGPSRLSRVRGCVGARRGPPRGLRRWWVPGS